MEWQHEIFLGLFFLKSCKMKQKFSLSFFVLSFLLVINVSAQYPRVSLWTADMNSFAAEDAINEIPQDVVLFAGSSTFRMWNSLQVDFPNSKVLNRAFGGSWMTDLIYFFDQVIKPYAPSQVVLYEGDNDLIESGKTPQSFLEDVITMTRLINIHYPNAKILLVSIKPSPSRQSYFPKYQEANTLMKNYADLHSHITYVNTWEPMLNPDGTPNTTLYLSDMLHMNRAGYDIWKEVLEPYLITSSTPVQESDKLFFSESSHANYHDYSWLNVTAPSLFSTVQAGKISTDSTHFFGGKTALRLSYQGQTGGDWQACVAAPMWKIVDVSKTKELELRVFSQVQINSENMPYMYLESETGTKTDKIALSDHVTTIPANTWTKVVIPVTAWKNISPAFTYERVKTIFFSQKNMNSEMIHLYVDDVIFRAERNAAVGSGDVFIDFGSSASLSANNWNNVTDHQAAVVDLKDKEGLTTGMTLKVIDPFFNGYNFNGTTSPSGNAADFLSTATQDNFFGHGLDWGTTPANPLGVIELSGLNTNYTYSLSFFGSRVSSTDNRETLFTATSADGDKSAALNTSNNTSEVAIISNAKPSNDGILTIRVEAGPNNNNSQKFFYIGAMKITIHVPSSSPVLPAESPAIKYKAGAILVSDYTGEVKVFDISGKKIKNGQSTFGYFPVSLSKGIYLIQTSGNNFKLLVN